MRGTGVAAVKESLCVQVGVKYYFDTRFKFWCSSVGYHRLESRWILEAVCEDVARRKTQAVAM